MGGNPAPSRTRSPNYPSIGLREALGRLKMIYEEQQQYPATREIIARLLGYGSLNGASASVVSALSKYGLLEGHGDNLRVSSLGQDLVLHRKGDPEYDQALRTVAFMPAFFRDLRDQYPQGLPSEHSLRATLVKRGFNPKAVDGAIRTYRETVELLNEEAARPSAQSSASVDVGQPSDAPSQRLGDIGSFRGADPNESRLRTVTLPLSATEWAALQAAFPLSETAWDQMIAVLAAMKPALVEVRSSPQSPLPPVPNGEINAERDQCGMRSCS